MNQFSSNGGYMAPPHCSNYQWPHPPGQYMPCPPFPPPHFQGGKWNQPTNHQINQQQPGDQQPTYPPFQNSYYAEQTYSHKRNYGNDKNNHGFHNKRRKMKESVFVDFCDVCDRGFKTDAKKDEHYKQHVKCTEPGCLFEAHFKLVEIHKKNLHGKNGLKIQLETPEDVKKWREERKKNFPTSMRVEAKLKDEAEIEESGAVLQTQSFGKFRQRRSNCGFRGGRNNSRGNYKNETILHTDERRYGGCKNESGNTAPTSDKLVYNQSHNPMDLLMKQSTNIKKECDSGNCEEEIRSIVRPTGNSLNALGLLVDNYGTDDDITDNETGDNVAIKIATDLQQTEQKLKDDPVCVEKPESLHLKDSSIKPSMNNRKPNQHENKNTRKYKNYSRLSRPSLLKMLLEPDIRRERNDILQCVRYIIKSDFFKTDGSV